MGQASNKKTESGSRLNRVGFVGWRGMVGSVLLQRMLAEDDFSLIDEPVFFTTSQAGQPAPDIGQGAKQKASVLVDANDLDTLASMDAIVTCQGGDYTKSIQPKLRSRGWNGYWIDAASALRMADDSTIILDPVNLPVIEQGLQDGRKDFIGGNCTVSLMMMALDGLFKADLVDWISVASYQAISGGGARQMRELIAQMGYVHQSAADLLAAPESSVLDIDKKVTDALGDKQFPTGEIGYPLTGSLLPWIDTDLKNGVSREEWKGETETNKILGRTGKPIPIESVCVRIGVLRCHSQAFTIKLNKQLPEKEIEKILGNGNQWVSVVPNNREQSLARLTPAAITATLDIAVGRVRNLNLSDAAGADNGSFISVFTVGDQLLWGAAEPLRRMLRILHQHLS